VRGGSHASAARCCSRALTVESTSGVHDVERQTGYCLRRNQRLRCGGTGCCARLQRLPRRASLLLPPQHATTQPCTSIAGNGAPQRHKWQQLWAVCCRLRTSSALSDPP
jgi:hypothetical protein